MPALRKFSSQADPKVLKELQDLAAREGRQSPRRSVLEAFHESIEERRRTTRFQGFAQRRKVASQ